MTRLPYFAERIFAARISEYGGVCHKVEEDVSGWDYLVELPPRSYDGPADCQPPRERAFVQVKSIEGPGTTVKIKLSNLRTSAQDPTPWFIVLVKKIDGEPVFYIKHFWRDLIERSLKKVREVDVGGLELNKRTMEIKFENSDIVEEDIVKFMQDILSGFQNYNYEKQKIYMDIGYDEGRGVGKVDIVGDRDEIYRNFLGLGDGLKISGFEFTPARFSIPDPARKISAVDGTFFCMPEPQGTCKIRFSPTSAEQALVLKGDVFAFSFDPAAPIRVSAPPVEILISPDGALSMSMPFQFYKKNPLNQWFAYARLATFALDGEIHVEIWLNDTAIDTAVRCDVRVTGGLNLLRLYSILSPIKSIADEWEDGDIYISLGDLEESIRELGYLSQGEAPSLKIECDAESLTDLNVTSFVYYSVADLGERTFGHIIRRNVVQDTIKDGRREIIAGNFCVLKTYLVRNADSDARSLIHEDYEHWLHRLEEKENPLGLGDFAATVRGGTNVHRR